MALDNLLRLLQSAGIFQQPQQIGNDLPSQGGISGTMPRSMPPLINRMSQLAPQQYQDPGQMSASTDAVGSNYPTPLLDQYKQLISQAPNPADYQPGKGRRLLAALAMGAGAGPAGISNGAAIGFRNDPRVGIETADQVLNGPYDRAVGNYMGRAKVLGEGATIEERANANKRMAARDAALDESRAEANRIREELGQAKNELSAAKTEDIRKQKENELQEKIREANMRADAAQQKLDQSAQNAQNLDKYRSAQIDLQNARMAAQEAQHALDNARNDAKFEEQKRLHDEQIKKLQAGPSGTGPTETTTERTEITPAQPGWFGTSIGAKPEQKKKVVETQTIKQPYKPGATSQANPDIEKAKAYLQKNGKPVTDKNVQYLLDHKDQW